MNVDSQKVGIIAAVNLALSGAGTFVTHIHSILDVLVPLGQFGVALVTIIYIITKIRKS